MYKIVKILIIIYGILTALFIFNKITKPNMAKQEQKISALEYYEEGLQQYEEGKYDVAIEKFNKAIEINPNNETFYLWRGLAKSPYIFPKPEPTIKKRDIFNLNTANHAHVQDHNFAIQDYNKAIEINSSYAEAYYARCRSKDYLGDYRGASQDCSKCITLNKKNITDCYNIRASIQRSLKNYQGAIKDYTKLIEINNKNAEAYSGRGYTKYLSGNINGALEDLSKAGELGDKMAYIYIQNIQYELDNR